ncbi:MAG: sensor histidine kinase [Pseudonocardiaceae bacterium]
MAAFQIAGSGTATTDTGPWARLAARAQVPRHRAATRLLIDVAAVSFAVLDVWLVIPEEAPTYSIVFSGIACAGLVARRWFPFLVLLVTVPGFMVGWSQLAAMLALGFLAHRKGMSWQTGVGAALVLACRFVLWPLEDMVALTWREHALDLIYGGIVAGMPVAIALLALARRDLSRRLAELDASRDRERRLHTRAIRADERARLAREMHDVVSHDVTLIAMQANALEVATTPEAARRTAATIRELGNRTLEELRSLVGVLRSSSDEEQSQPGLPELEHLVRAADVPVQLKVDNVSDSLPSDVSAAAYRTVQEALTNVHKHAAGATATVLVSLDGRSLRVVVRNDRPTGPSRGLPSGGHGLAGLAERALLLGGTFHARSTDDGGFEVRAHYPIGSPVPASCPGADVPRER